MEIKLLGCCSALIKGKKENILINPSDEVLKIEKNSRIVVWTDNGKSNFDMGSERIFIGGAGEYEIGGVEIVGWDVSDNKTIYTILVDGVLVLVLGQLDESLSEKRIEKIEGVDVLLAPTSIGNESSFKMISSWTKKWGVNYLIPDSSDKEMLTKFLDLADEEGIEAIDSLKVEKDNLPDGLELKLLKIV